MSLRSSEQGAREIAAAVRGGRVTAVQAVEAALARIEALDGRLNSFRKVLPERALRDAAAVDAALAAGRDPGPLAGVPYGVKDLFDVAGLATAAGSKIGLERAPAGADAVLVARLRAAGAVLLGVQTMDEYAYGFTTENAHFGAVRNPHDLTRTAGGSSGGSAAAVAAGLGAFALGSDTNGSIRVPSSFCGVFGLKPTFGRLPRTGSFPFVFDLDHLGLFARSVEDLAQVYDALQGHDAGDPACAARAAEPVSGRLAGGPLRVAVLDGWFQEMADDDARAAVAAAAEALGARARASLPGAETARSAAFLITAASGANLHRANLRARPGDFDPATRGRLLAGGLLPADALIQAQRLRRRFYDEALAAFATCDLLLAPATPCAAPRLGQAQISLGGRDAPTRPNLGVLSQPLSAIGLPIVAAPIRLEGAAPLGVQLVAPPWREDLAFQAAARLQAAGLAAAPVVDP
ncbi:AtzE family amidohydrolase [Phenylobacterium sp.]|jgi:AtzE family amidohydrolase|uniref:AtzE family amidohydrolase n=1 Tax=Phenylobacterium sp. TaxID=1871053 RepID=UPI002F411284